MYIVDTIIPVYLVHIQVGTLLMIKIILADDHQIVRRGLKLCLNTEKIFQIIGEAKMDWKR